jgi:hypothetical protein
MEEGSSCFAYASSRAFALGQARSLPNSGPAVLAFASGKNVMEKKKEFKKESFLKKIKARCLGTNRVFWRIKIKVFESIGNFLLACFLLSARI